MTKIQASLYHKTVPLLYSSIHVDIFLSQIFFSHVILLRMLPLATCLPISIRPLACPVVERGIYIGYLMNLACWATFEDGRMCRCRF